MSDTSSDDFGAPPKNGWANMVPELQGDREGGQREVIVQDPDGYLVLVAHDLGERPTGTLPGLEHNGG